MKLATSHIAAISAAGMIAAFGVIAAVAASGTLPAPPVVAYSPVEEPAPAAAPAAAVETPAAAPNCETQAWPNIDRACLTNATQERAVRQVTPPRPSDGFNGKWAALPQDMRYPAPSAPDTLTTSDTVLRGPQKIEAAPPVAEKKPRVKREAKRKPAEQRYAVQQYRVPAEAYGYDRSVVVYRRAAGPFGGLFD